MQYLDLIDKLSGKDKLYPSRSELVRIAIHEYLIKELEAINQFAQYQKKAPEYPFRDLDKASVENPSKIEKLFKTYNLD